MEGVNRVLLCGRCGADPEVRYAGEGNAVANLSLATSRHIKQGGETKQETEWHRLVAFGKTAGVIDQFVRKGRLLFVEGRLQTRKWTDKSGTERQSTEIVVEQLQLLDRPRDEDEIPGSRSARQTTVAAQA